MRIYNAATAHEYIASWISEETSNHAPWISREGNQRRFARTAKDQRGIAQSYESISQTILAEGHRQAAAVLAAAAND